MFSKKISKEDFSELKKLENKEIKAKYVKGRPPKKVKERMFNNPNYEEQFYKNRKKEKWRTNTKHKAIVNVSTKTKPKVGLKYSSFNFLWNFSSLIGMRIPSLFDLISINFIFNPL